LRIGGHPELVVRGLLELGVEVRAGGEENEDGKQAYGTI